jgi:hypothetical protein
MIEWRLYRVAFLPAIVAAIALLFSLQGVPEPLEAPVSLASFDEDGAAQTAREIVRLAPDRAPGSPGDAEIADMVTERFGGIPTAQVSEQTYSDSFEGEDVEPRNVIATLPGETDRRLVVMAPRDSAGGQGAASSAAATGMLLELAESFGGASHSKTLVFVSSAGATDGARGAREFADNYPEREAIDAALVISQPGAARPEPPFVIPWSTGSQSTAIQLTRTAATLVSAELGEPAGLQGSFEGLLRLAIPTGLGEQGPLIEEGIDAVRISSSGEAPLSPAEDSEASLSEESMADLGDAAQTIILALDDLEQRPEHGPAAYVVAGSNLVPGWAIALLVLTLLVPAVVAAADGFARAMRRDLARSIDVSWVVGRSLPFLGLLVLTYLLAIVGLLPSPRFPYDPARFSIDVPGALALVLLAGALVGAWIATRPVSVPRRADHEGLITATGLVMSGAALAIWLLNPYLALLAVPAAHAWLAGTAHDPRVRLGASVAAVVMSLVPAIVALAWVAGRLEVGAAAPWHLLLMVGGGHIGLGIAVLGCVLAGGLVAIIAAAIGPGAPSAPEPRVSARGSDRPADEVDPDDGGAAPSGFDVAPGRVQTGVDNRRIFDGRRLTIRFPKAD